MAYVGKLSVWEDNGSAGSVFNFINVNFPGGWPESSLQRVGEPITGGGVDGTRARYTRSDYPTFIMRTVSEAASFDAAITLVDSQRLNRIKRATIEVVTNGITYTFGGRKSYIWGVSALPVRADVVTLLGAIVAPQGMVYTDWTLQFIPGT